MRRELTPIDTWAYANNTTERRKLPKVSPTRKYVLKFTGTFTKTGGAGDGTVVEDNPYTAVDILRLKVAGNTVLKALDPRNAAHKQSYVGGVAKTVQSVSGNGNQTTTVSFELDIQFSPDHLKGWETVDLGGGKQLPVPKGDAFQLNTTQFQSLTLEVEHADQTSSFISGGTGTKTLTGTFTLYAVENVGNVLSRFLFNEEQTDTHNITVTDTDAKFELDPAGSYRRLLLVVRDNAARSNARIGNVKLIANKKRVVYDKAWADIQRDNERDYGVASITGVAIVDLDDIAEGLLQDVLDADGLEKLELEFDQSTGTNAAVDIVAERYFKELEGAEA